MPRSIVDAPIPYQLGPRSKGSGNQSALLQAIRVRARPGSFSLAACPSSRKLYGSLR